MFKSVLARCRKENRDQVHPSRKAHPPLQPGISPPMRGYVRPPYSGPGQQGMPRHEPLSKRSLSSPDDAPWSQNRQREGTQPEPLRKSNLSSPSDQAWSRDPRQRSPSRVSPGEALGMAGLHALADSGNAPGNSPEGPTHVRPGTAPAPVEDQDFLCREDGPVDQDSDNSPPVAVYPGHPQIQGPPMQGSLQEHREALLRFSQQNRGPSLAFPAERDMQADAAQYGRTSQQSGHQVAQQPSHMSSGQLPPSSQSGSSMRGPMPMAQRPTAWPRGQQTQDLPQPARPLHQPTMMSRARLHPEDRHRVARRIEEHEILALQTSQAARAVQSGGKNTADPATQPQADAVLQPE